METHRNISNMFRTDLNVTVEESNLKLSDSVIFSGVLAIVSLVGVLGNGTLVFIFARHRTMRTVSNTYILSLALGDLLVILFTICFNIDIFMTKSWVLGKPMCKLIQMTKDVSTGASVFSLTALSAERYCVIVNPIKNHTPSKSHTIFTVIVIWIISLVLALPVAISATVVSVYRHNQTIKVCLDIPWDYDPRYEKVSNFIKFIVYYAIPLCFITSFYGLMYRHLMLSTRKIPGENSLCTDQSNQIQARKKVAKMALSIVILFMMCYLPYQIYILFYYFHPSSLKVYEDFWKAFSFVAYWLSFINSCIIPIALYFMSKAFRQYFNQYLFFCVKGPPL